MEANIHAGLKGKRRAIVLNQSKADKYNQYKMEKYTVPIKPKVNTHWYRYRLQLNSVANKNGILTHTHTHTYTTVLIIIFYHPNHESSQKEPDLAHEHSNHILQQQQLISHRCSYIAVYALMSLLSMLASFYQCLRKIFQR